MLTLCILCGLSISTITAAAPDDSGIKIHFAGQTKHERPVRDPDSPLGNEVPIRRSYWSPKDNLCTTTGSTAGALAAYRLTTTGQLSPGIQIPGHILVDLRSFVSMVAGSAIAGLDSATGCSLPVLQSAAEDMCMQVICSSGGMAIPRERCIAVALHQNGVLGAMPTLQRFLPASANPSTCSSPHFNFKINGADFNKNPQLYVNQLTTGVSYEVQDIYRQLKISQAMPVDVPPRISATEIEYMKRTVQGAVIATYVAKLVAQNGEIASIPGLGHHDITAFLTNLIASTVRKIGVQPMQEAIRAHNIAMKMTLYWLINNFDLVKTSPPNLITGNTLMALGLAPFFPSVPALFTNNALVNPAGKFVKFFGIRDALEPTSDILESRIPIDQILKDVAALMPQEKITVPEEVIMMQIQPIEKPSKINTRHVSPLDPLADTEGAKGSLPNPENWFSLHGPMKNVSEMKDNAVLLGTLATIIGAHAGQLTHQFGIITKDNEPGYKDLSNFDIYDVIQKLNQELVTRLASVIPMSLETGFSVLNGAFKTTKLALNIEGQPDTKALIPLGLKQNKLLKLYPDLEDSKWDLYPLPEKLNVLKLWVKPIYDTDVESAVKDRVSDLASARFPKIISDVVSIFKYHIPSLQIHNLRSLPDRIADSQSLPWDPPEAISYLYDPSSSDGVPSSPSQLIQTTKRKITCPDHFMCPGGVSGHGHYVCVSADPWCYLPPGLKCPGSIQCPVVLSLNQQPVECPNDSRCPVSPVICPGGTECSDSTTICPGRPNCPLIIKCPGILCPARYVNRPQLVVPCPEHVLCSQPPSDTLLCQNDLSCSYPNPKAASIHAGGEIKVQVINDNSDLVAAIREAGSSISTTLDRKELSVNINNTAVSHITLDGERVASSASGTIIRDKQAAAASAASASAASASAGGNSSTPAPAPAPAPRQYLKLSPKDPQLSSQSYAGRFNANDYPDYEEKPASAVATALT